MTAKFEIPKSLQETVRVLLGAITYGAVRELGGEQAVKDLKILYTSLDNALGTMDWNEYKRQYEKLTTTKLPTDIIRAASLSEAYELGYTEGYEDGVNDR